MQTEPRLIIADADGTLINKGSIKSVPASLGKAIRALRRQGINFIIASGRPYSFLKELHHQIISDSPKNPHEGLVYESGCYHIFANKNPVIAGGLTSVQLKELDAYLSCTDLQGLVPLPDAIFETRRSFVTPTFAAEGNTDKMLLAKAYSILAPQIAARFPYTHTVKSSDAFDIEAKRVSKATALLPYLQEIGIKPVDCLVIGDSSNDFPMFDLVGKGGGIVAYVGTNQEQKRKAKSFPRCFIPEEKGPLGTLQVLQEYFNHRL